LQKHMASALLRDFLENSTLEDLLNIRVKKNGGNQAAK
uniref:Transcriptional regulator n=1 Tax=Haemonchus placei TaxID=6290 RepID=A0A0N4X8Q9_HAEPC